MLVIMRKTMNIRHLENGLFYPEIEKLVKNIVMYSGTLDFILSKFVMSNTQTNCIYG